MVLNCSFQTVEGQGLQFLELVSFEPVFEVVLNSEMNGGERFLRRLRLLEIAKLSFNFFPGFCTEFFDDGFTVRAVTERDFCRPFVYTFLED